MTNDQNIPDELLAKYMSRQTTPEGDAAVEDYAAASDENIDELMHIATAVKAQAASQRAARNRRMIKIASAVAAVAILALGVSVFFLINNRKDESFAQQTTENTSVEVVSEREEVNDENVGFGDTISYNVRTKEEVKDKEDLFVMKKEEKKWAEKEIKEHFAKIVYPSREELIIEKSKSHIRFLWNTDADKTILIVKNNYGALITKQIFETETNYDLAIPNNTDTLLWNILFSFSNGDNIEKSGEILIKKKSILNDRN